ncbi:MAG: helicase HerA-like domain-containing protein [Arcanobacterium sp.]
MPDIQLAVFAAMKSVDKHDTKRSVDKLACLVPYNKSMVSPADSHTPEISSYARTVHHGYAFDDAFTIGTYLDNGTPLPGVDVNIPLSMLNRHGLIAGATGTGKTRTVQLLAEALSNQGVPVFLTDIKGDLTGLLEPGTESERLRQRAATQGQIWAPASFPCELYALGGRGNGTPIRTTVTDFGPILLAKVLGLNSTQESALSLIFHWADSEQLALIDLNDLRAVTSYLASADGKEILTQIGGIAPATAGVILREIAVLQAQGADAFFGEPAFEISEFIRQHADGRGIISLLELPDVQSRPALFSTFIMWLLAELFETMPEVGDVDKPQLVFFFDEAHLLFNKASEEFLSLVVQTVRLIRSKGVGIFFITQSPKDIPEDVLAQLGAKIQHALRAHTPNEAKALRETVKTFPISELDLEQVLPALGTGEAIVTVLDPQGRPTPVAPTRIWAPAAVMGVASDEAITNALANSVSLSRYSKLIDPESAMEILNKRIAEQARAKEAAKEQDRLVRELEKQLAAEKRAAEKEIQRRQREADREAERARRRRESTIDAVVKTAGRTLAREITRGIFGNRRR